MWLSTGSAILTIIFYTISLQFTCGNKDIVGITGRLQIAEISLDLTEISSSYVRRLLEFRSRWYMQ